MLKTNGCRKWPRRIKGFNGRQDDPLQRFWGGSAPVNNAGYLKNECEACEQQRERKKTCLNKNKVIFCFPHRSSRSTPLSRYHGNGVHRIKTLDRSIRILPRTGTSLLILPGLSQALLGNLCVFSHRGGNVRKTHSHVSQRSSPGQPHRNLR